MSVYMDASFIVPLFLEDAFSERADTLIALQTGLVVSDWCVVEVSSVLMRQTRIRAISLQTANTILANFDA